MFLSPVMGRVRIPKTLFFLLVLYAVIKALDLSGFLRGQADVYEQDHLVLVFESIEWNYLPSLNNRRPKGCHCLSSQFPERVGMVDDFRRYDFQNRELFETELCLAGGSKISGRPS